MLKEPSKIPEPIPESLAAIKTAQVGTLTIQSFKVDGPLDLDSEWKIGSTANIGSHVRVENQKTVLLVPFWEFSTVRIIFAGYLWVMIRLSYGLTGLEGLSSIWRLIESFEKVYGTFERFWRTMNQLFLIRRSVSIEPNHNCPILGI